jgi:hypothetical protein
MLSASLASTNAKFWPTQIRGPQPNGKNAGEPLDALDMPSANLSTRPELVGVFSPHVLVVVVVNA